MLKTQLHRQNCNGFILPITLGLISLVGLWGTILIEQMHIQSAQIEKSWQEKLIFYQAQEHLHQCIAQQNFELTSSMIVNQCCLVEALATSTNQRTSRAAQQKLYRVSVNHQLLHPLSKKILGSSRLQANFILMAQSKEIIARSWREIFDLSWEREFSKQSANKVFIWDQLPACEHLFTIH